MTNGQAEPLSRDELLAKYPYLDQQGRKMVVGSDLDALLSATYLQETLDWDVVGFYTGFESIYYTDREAIGEAVWVDLDINRPDARSVGHHILRTRPDEDLHGLENSLNPNEERGVSTRNFTSKYPLGTIHLLLWLHEETSFSPLQRAFLLSADSTWVNAQRYTDNVTEWVENCLPLDWLTDAIEAAQTEEFERRIQNEVFPRIEAAGFSHGGSSGRSQSTHLGLNGWQCSFTDPRAEKVRNLVELLGDVMDWRPLDVPADMRVERGTRNSTNYEDVRSEHGGLDSFLQANDVFSYAIPSTYRGVSINYTTDIDL